MFLHVIHRPVLSKTQFCLHLKTECFGDWILSPPSGKTYSFGPNPKIGAGCIDWFQLSRFYLKTETESGLWNVVFLNINRAMDNAQKHNVGTNVPSSQILDLISKTRAIDESSCGINLNF
jgi:hypothetical protein